MRLPSIFRQSIRLSTTDGLLIKIVGVILLFGRNESAPTTTTTTTKVDPTIKRPEPIRIASSSLPEESELNFMKQFGYLDSSGPQQLQSGDALIDIIKQVQLFGGINRTGILDESTKRLMKSKRCGVPDIQPKGERYKRYTFGSKGWNKRTMTYYISNWSPQLGEQVVNSEIQRAFDMWAKYGHLTFKRTYNEKADIIVQFGRRHHGDPFPFDGPGSVLAHAFFPMETTPLGGDIHFDEDEKWSIAPDISGDSVHFFAVAIHELGHSVGLAHSSEPDSIMNPYYKAGQYLGQDDIRAMYELYITRHIPEDNEQPTPPSPRATSRPTAIPNLPKRPPPTQRPVITRSPYRPSHQFPNYDGNNVPLPPARPPYGFLPHPPKGERENDEFWKLRTRYDSYTDTIPTSRPYLIPRIEETTTSSVKPSTAVTTTTTAANSITTTTTKPGTRTTASATDRSTPQLTYHGDDELMIDHIKHDHKHDDIEDKNSIYTIGCSIQISAGGLVRGELFFFERKTLWRAQQPKYVMPGYPVEFSKFFRTLPEDIKEIDAIYERCTDSNIIIFSGNKYYVFDGNRVINGSPRPISDYGIPDSVNTVDAVLPLEDSITYLFSEDRYFRYNETSSKIESSGLIQKVFKNIPNNLDAALLWTDGLIYFFKGTQFWTVDRQTFRIKSEQPRQISDYWLSCDVNPVS